MIGRSKGRAAGLLLPLFSMPSTASWGIGDIGDLKPLCTWLVAAGQQVLQLLPLNEMAAGQQSPYSAITAMAIDPIYIALAAVEDFAAIGGEPALSAMDHKILAEVRASPRVDYTNVRPLKQRALDRAFAVFLEREWRRDSPRAARFRTFLADQAWWLDDYALFRALHAREAERAWTEWPAPLRNRLADALAEARTELADEILRWQYFQWLADTQWEAARAAANGCGLRLFGDLPFMVDGDSADVWANQPCFILDASVGVPPDAFSATGQDWGMPVYRWDAMAANDFRWLRARARRSAHLFDGYRVDHLVGFYRTYGRARSGGPPFFTPSEEREQTALGERVLTIFREAGAEIIAEDLGTVPDFVRESLTRMDVPGFRVARWEREWDEPDQPFRDPADYPARSVATTGTHDTASLAVWWAEAPPEERALLAEVPSIAALSDGVPLTDLPFDPGVRDILLASLFASGSDLLLMPVQDVFGWRDRINQPATVNDQNWTYRLPWPVDRLDRFAEARERRQQLRAWALEARRLDREAP
jgi:4-alpha-glucanotransferase